jgi:hypothetical protein
MKLIIFQCSNADVLDIIVPSFCREATPNTAQDWNYTTTPQVGLNGRSIAYNRGFVLGGSSSVSKSFLVEHQFISPEHAMNVRLHGLYARFEGGFQSMGSGY